MTAPAAIPAGFTHPKTGERFLLVGSHTSVVREGEQPKRKLGCVGCDLQLAESREG